MKKKWTILLLVIFGLTSMFITSCSDDDDDDSNITTMDAADVVAYMNDHGLKIADVLTGWKKSAADVYALISDADTTNDPYIMDLRSATLYGKGHIPGAHNVALADVITHADENITDKDTPIAVCCYTGQSACHGVVGLRLAGYPNAYSIGYGMSGWANDIDGNSDGDLDDDVDLKLDYFTGGVGNYAETMPETWVAAPGDAVPPTTTYDYPDVSYEGDDEDAILKARGQYVVEHFQKVAAYKGDGTGALENVDNTDWFINHYWTKVADYGNIKNSWNISNYTDNITLLDPTKKIVNCCYTGQSASIVCAYLTAIGYDSWTLGNGANSMLYDQMTTNGTGWGVYINPDLPLEGSLFP